MNYLDNSISGVWNGWGYFSTLPNLGENNFQPKFIKVETDYLKILPDEFNKPEIEIETISLKWVCGYKVICNPSNYTKYSYNQATIDEVTQTLELFIKEIKVNAQ